MLTTNISELMAQARVSTVGDLLDRGIPATVISDFNDAGVSVVSGASLVEVLNTAATSIAIDPRFIGVIDTFPVFRTPIDAATFFIGLKYNELGNAGGTLGSTATAVTPCPDGQGFFRHFQGGSIYWHPATGAHAVLVGIREKWASLGWERGFLGYPVSDELKGRDLRGAGSYSRFQGGTIYRYINNSVAQPPVVAAPNVLTLAATVAPRSIAATTTLNAGAVERQLTLGRTDIASATVSAAAANVGVDTAAINIPFIPIFLPPTFEVHGAIRRKYDMLGGEASFLGYPTTDETTAPDGVGRYNHFQAGSIYWTPNTSAWEVHGLIRNYWASTGWERGPLGYPISDELIPDRRIGHRRPESRRKPLLEVPVDTVKLPLEAVTLGFPPTAVNIAPQLGTTVRANLRPLALDTTVASRSPTISAVVNSTTIGTRGPRTDVGPVISIDPGVIGILGIGPASTAAAEQSRNRYGDFENGVVFWRRGDTEARPLSPWLSATDGTKTHFTGGEVAAAVWPQLRQALAGSQGVQVLAANFLGTTGYWFDGLSVHNRRHRIAVQMLATRMTPSFPFVPLPTPVFAEVQVECVFEPTERKVVAVFTDWNAAAIPGDLLVSPALVWQLQGPLDGLLWTRVDLLQLPDTDAGNPIAVLSAKTQINGDVNVYIEA